MKKYKLVFFGTPQFAVTSLALLIKAGYEVVAVVTQPDRPVGRRQILQPSPVKLLALEHNILVLQPEKIRNNVEFIKQLQALSPDIMVVVAYGKIIPKNILTLSNRGCLNVHASLLPKFRGASPIQTALLLGEKETGVTLMLMDEHMDTGPVYAQKKIILSAEDDGVILSKKLSLLGAKLLVEKLPLILEKKLEPVPQTETGVSYCQLITKEDAKINWQQPAQNILNKIRAFYPWPGTYTLLENKRLKIISAKAVPFFQKALIAGQISVQDNRIYVACQDAFLEIVRMQMEGKKELAASEFLQGYNLQGEQFK